MFNRILVPLDGSNLAEKVLPAASYLAERLQATLILFHVVEKDSPNEIHGQHHLREVAEARAYLDQVARQLSSAQVAVLQDVHEVQEMGVAQTIRDHAEELHSDMIILCAHGNGGLRDMLFGSIAQQVIRQGTIPVLFIRPDMVKDTGMNPIQQILLPLDGSKAHEVAMPVAVYLAAKCEAKIRLLTVVPTAETLPVKGAITGRVSPRMTALTLDISAQQAEEYLHKISHDLLTQGMPVSSVVLRGNAESRLIETIAAEGIDLVVMATHGHSAIDAHWEGSLTPRFLPKTPVPVMLVRGIQDNSE
ncbi:MAG: universal stress protein [Anaerolineaceae bacterium]|nr:universal stress protein [Anaerolineaceae bacterium]